MKKYVHWLIIIILSVTIFGMPHGNADELWNYNFAKNILNGLVPYRDISMVITPLAAYIAAGVMQFIGTGLFAYRIVSFIFMSIIFIVFYELCSHILKNRTIGFVSALFSYALSLAICSYDYNYLSLLIVLLILCLERKEFTAKKANLNNILIGFLFGLLPIVKQSTGGVLLVINFVVCIYDALWLKKIRESIVRAVVSVIPGIIYLVILIATGMLNEFIDYAVVGIQYFNHRLTMLQFICSSGFAGVLVLVILSMIIFSVVKMMRLNYVNRTNLVIFLITVTWFFCVTFPLFDYSHFCVGMLPIQVMFFSNISEIKISKGQVALCEAIGLLVVAISVSTVVTYGEDYTFSSFDNYKKIPISTTLEKQIVTVCEYIESKEAAGTAVYIADTYAAVYMIALDKYRKNWDMLNVGNLGSASVEELLNVEENRVFLILDDSFILNRQSHYELINSIKDNYTWIDEVACFDVYK